MQCKTAIQFHSTIFNIFEQYFVNFKPPLNTILHRSVKIVIEELKVYQRRLKKMILHLFLENSLGKSHKGYPKNDTRFIQRGAVITRQIVSLRIDTP